MPTPTFTYIQGVPNPPNLPATDVGNMKTNTNSIYSYLAIDHIPFGDPNNGTHNQVTMPQIAAPGISNGAGAFFTGGFKGGSWPFFQNASGTFPMLGPSNDVQNGYTYLPGGMLLQWGTGTMNGTRSTPVSFNITFNNLWSVIPSIRSNTVSVGYFNESTSGFSVVTSASTGANFFWIAIGN